MMEAGKYFQKTQLLSDKIQELLDQILMAQGINTNNNNNSFPDTIFIRKPQQYQEYFHLSCKQNKYYENYYKSSPIKNKQKQLKQPKQSKQQKQKQQQQQIKGKKDIDLPAIGRCIFKVGKILEISDHNNADSMYVEMIDIGEDKPRQICSGIKGKISKEEMINSYVVVFSNLKKAKLRGIESNGMILAASNNDKSILEIVRPPKGTIIGERIILEDQDLKQYNPTNDIKPNKKNNPWTAIKDDLKTNQNAIACYKGRKFITSMGPLRVKSLSNATIS